MSGDNGNGKQKQINGLKHEDNLINSKLDALKVSVDTLAKDFKVFIAPDGVYDKHRRRAEGFMTQVKLQWWLIGVVILGLAGVAFAVLESGAAG